MKWVRRDAMGPAAAGAVVLAAGLATSTGWVDWPGVGRWLQARAGVAAAVVVGGVLLALAARRQWPRASPRASRTLSWSVVAVGGALVAAVTWGATAWLLQQAERAQDPAAARVEAVKTGLGIGAGTGGMFALLLAVRRQWHQELSAADTIHDATERRVTELYTKAADQLGSDKPAVRLAGLYALERVAQDNETQRQTVVNVLAAYLRMPFDPPDDSASQESGDADTNVDVDLLRREYRERTQELEVRVAAQRILIHHLRPGATLKTPEPTFWANIDLDLTGAVLVAWDMSNCHVNHATFDGATFTRFISFDGTRFDGEVAFHATRFLRDATFDGAEFGFDTWFTGAQFNRKAQFSGAQFNGKASFIKTQFGGFAGFGEAQFGSFAWFDDARFDGAAAFHGTQFGDDAWFTQAYFDGKALLGNARFDGHAGFNMTHFGDEAVLIDAQFNSQASFSEARFDHAVLFSGARFDGEAHFIGTQFGSDAVFHLVQFHSKTTFSEAEFIKEIPPEIALHR